METLGFHTALHRIYTLCAPFAEGSHSMNGWQTNKAWRCGHTFDEWMISSFMNKKSTDTLRRVDPVSMNRQLITGWFAF